MFLQGHAGSAIRVDRAGRMAHVDRPALSFNLMIQPGLMSELAGSSGFRDSGLLARFLYAIPATNVGKRDVRKHSSIDAEVRDKYERGVMSLLEGWLCEPGTVPKVQVLDLNDAARECGWTSARTSRTGRATAASSSASATGRPSWPARRRGSLRCWSWRE